MPKKGSGLTLDVLNSEGRCCSRDERFARIGTTMLTKDMIENDGHRIVYVDASALAVREPGPDDVSSCRVDILGTSSFRKMGVEVTPGCIVKRQAAYWNGMSAEIVQMTRREKFEIRSRARSHLLVVYDQVERIAGETIVEGLPRSTLREVRKKLTFVPAGLDYREWHDPRGQSRLIFIYIDPEIVSSLLGAAEAISFAPKMFFESATLRDTTTKVVASLEGGLGEGPRYLEALGSVLVHELNRLTRGVGARRSPARGGLAGWQERAVATYIEENLDQTIPVAKLAGLARLSEFYFCRAFKRSFGLPPHRYHVMRRIEQAKVMLANAKPSVTEIGLAVGFSEASSFTTAFRKATGQTPSAYRRSFS